MLGTREKNVIEVTDCFTVPHNETDQEVCLNFIFTHVKYTLLLLETLGILLFLYILTFSLYNIYWSRLYYAMILYLLLFVVPKLILKFELELIVSLLSVHKLLALCIVI